MGNFTVYKSSAGSGKTYTLVREYLLLALFGNSRRFQSEEKTFFPNYFRHILAITFTNKAAAEMKQRILTSLTQLSRSDDFADSPTIKFMLLDLAKSAACTPEEVSLRSAKVLNTLLHDYDNFAISTIDSFVTRIIQTFAHDLHLPADFQIELDKMALLQPAVDRLISKVGSDHDLTSLLIQFAETKADDERNWNIENDILQISQNLFEEDGYPFVARLSETHSEQILHIANFIRNFCKSFEQRLAVIASEALQICESAGIKPEHFFQSKTGIGAYFIKISKAVWDSPKPNSYVIKTIDENNWYSKTQDKNIAALIDGATGQLADRYQKIQEEINTHYQNYVLLTLVGKNIYQIGVLNGVERELEALKREQNVLHISEFNRRITDIIQSEPTPFIYERIGEKFHHYLLDEFQDTSELQWKNLLPLLSNALATAQFNLIVGDGKQAIYRWRNGQVDQFASLPELPQNYDLDIFGEAAQALAYNYDEKYLESNFRSLPQVIDFNNRFFDFASADALSAHWQKIYNRQAQQSISGKMGGLVSVYFADGERKQEYEEATLAQIGKTIDLLLTDGYRLQDVAILIRSNKEGNLVAQYLSNRGITVISPDSLLLTSAPEINLLVSCMKWLAKPSDKIAATAVLHFLSVVAGWPFEKSQSLFAELASRNHLEKILKADHYAFSGQRLQNLTLYDLCEELIRMFKLNGIPNPYLQAFLDFVNTQQADNASQLTDLLEIWEKKKGTLSLPSQNGLNAVSVMTIHKSKGLEFPVVVWAFAAETCKVTKGYLWEIMDNPLLQGLPVALLKVNKDFGEAGFEEDYIAEKEKSLLDMLNLMYVAMTRPVDRLYIISKEIDLNKNSKETMAQSMQKLLKNFVLRQTDWLGVCVEHAFGQPSKPQNNAHQDKEDSHKLEKAISNNWHRNVRIAATNPLNSKNTEASERHREWGNLIHWALSQAKLIDNLELITQHLLVSGQLPESRKAEFLNQIWQVIEHPELKPYFLHPENSGSEVEIIAPNGEILRPDRIYIHENEVSILEFKTGAPKKQHKEQLQQYASVLAEMNFKISKKILVYIDRQVTIVYE